MKKDQNQTKQKRYRKTLPATVRFAAIGIITLLLLVSLFNVYSAYQTPTTKTINTPLLTFDHRGRFDYTIFLHNNTLYDNKTTLGPGEGTLFKQLIDHIDIFFTYTFQINQNATINGNYSIDAVLQTNYWEKTYPLIPRTPFTAHGRQASVTTQFPAEITFYEEILKKINEETGVTAQNPLVRFQTSVVVQAYTANKTTTRAFSPNIEIYLGQRTIEFSKVLSSTQPGSVTESITIEQPEVTDQRNTWTASSALFLIALPAFLLITTQPTKSETKTEKEIRKIKKKYGEWIVETHTQPKHPKTSSISVTSLEDLSKVSEELGKPILLYASPPDNKYLFYILEDHLMYQYMFKPREKNKKDATIPPKYQKEKHSGDASGNTTTDPAPNDKNPELNVIDPQKEKTTTDPSSEEDTEQP